MVRIWPHALMGRSAGAHATRDSERTMSEQEVGVGEACTAGRWRSRARHTAASCLPWSRATMDTRTRREGMRRGDILNNRRRRREGRGWLCLVGAWPFDVPFAAFPLAMMQFTLIPH